MRILFLNTYYYPNMFGGAEHSVKLLVDNFAKNHVCAVFTADGDERGLCKTIKNNVCIYRSGSICFDYKSRFNKTESFFCKIKNRMSDLNNPIALKHFILVMQDFKPDIIHTNGLRGIGPKVWMLAKKNGVKVVHTLRDYYAADPLMREHPPSGILISMWRYLWNRASSNLDCVVAPSMFTLKKMFEYGFAKGKTSFAIPNAIPYCEHVFFENISFSKNRNSEKTRFLFAGTLVEFKGVLKLIDAFEKLQKKNPNVELVICGTGPLQRQIVEIANKNTRILYQGKVSAESMQNEYLCADVCVVPSLWEEPFGRVVIEAAYNGCALITSDRGGIPEILKQLGTGISCDCSDTKKLAEAMYSLCCKENRCAQLDVLQKNVCFFSVANNVVMFERLYRSILEQ